MPPLLGALVFLLIPLFGVTPARAAASPRIAVFDFEMVNTSLQPTTPEEQDRLRRLGEQLRTALQQSGKYQVVDIAPVRAEVADAGGILKCNGCEQDLARKLGADEIAVGWVQKVSNLILNINLSIVQASDGKQLRGGSVDIRGNTDEAWSRGLKFLLEERVFND
jgi:hypothetical protein